ncbi:hypothetical protein GIB67_004439 [Kingdonia uniflora]|uniref:Uncharacterized protein n=1 Tax=Kingdonia uniflora TaxID=39325 RepID=A0A7J7MRG0_9MAGN|nr:hypothetical protein GIB67_004439 [Kingdonia uniflora]
MEFGRIFWFWVLSVGEVQMGFSLCSYPAIFNFGDSNSDTGGMSATFLPIPPPNGESFFGRPSGRACDGRLVVDFMAEHLGLPYLSPYLDSIWPNFGHGANFATGGSTIRPQNKTLFEAGVSPFSLNVQLWQFDQFKSRTIDLYNRANPDERSYLPKLEDFSNALYTIDIGQNDLTAGFRKMSEDQVQASIPEILDQFSDAVQRLYQLGARIFWIHNTGPIGCLPMTGIYFGGSSDLLDQLGCVRSHNDMAVEFNTQLKDRVCQLRGQLNQTSLIYVDVYAAKYGLISDAVNQGFTDPLHICCGYHELVIVGCGQKINVNGTEIYGASCGNPSTYVSWDGTHYSQAANHWIANSIFNGTLSDPQIPIDEACNFM